MSEIIAPSGYLRLAALRRINNSAYFNTGVVAGSELSCDIYFSNVTTYENSNHSVFGIRRASGTGDAKMIGLYTKTTAYFAGHAIVEGSADTSNITGSGTVAKFGGNLMKISARNGKWYEWDRYIADLSSQSFSNTDNTPIFLGLLAKNATTIYANSSNLFDFHEAVFYDGNGNMAHRFLPYKNDSNQLGFWDTIVGEFKTVNDQSHWAAVSTYTLRSLRVHSRFYELSTSLNWQSCVEKKGWQICCTDTQRYFALSNEKYEIHAGSTLSMGGRLLECSEYNAGWHGNACWWSDTYADANDYFPLLYVSTDKANHLLTVYRLAGSDPTTCTISLVQKIYTPEGDTVYGSTLYYHNYYGKGGCNTFVQTAYTKDSYNSNSGSYAGNVLMYRVFPLPALSEGSEVSLTESDILARGDVGFMSTTSNGGWNGKYLYITFLKNLVFWQINTNGATRIKSLDFYNSTSPDFITTGEMEGFSWYEQGGYFVSMWEPTYGNTLDSYADDLKIYARGSYQFGEERINIVHVSLGDFRRRLMMGVDTVRQVYISRDLFVQFDGIWNAGIGKHTNDVSGIVNLVTGEPFTSVGYDSGVGTNCVFQSTTNVANSLRLAKIDLSNNIELTVEFVLKTTSYRSVNRGGFVHVGSGSQCDVFTWDLNSSPYWRFHKNNSNTSTSVRYYADGNTHTFAFRSTSTDVKLYRDGSQIGSWTISGSIKDVAAGVSISLGGYAGEFYAARFYTRALTVDELQFNYNIDRQRFNF